MQPTNPTTAERPIQLHWHEARQAQHCGRGLLLRPMLGSALMGKRAIPDGCKVCTLQRNPTAPLRIVPNFTRPMSLNL